MVKDSMRRQNKGSKTQRLCASNTVWWDCGSLYTPCFPTKLCNIIDIIASNILCYIISLIVIDDDYTLSSRSLTGCLFYFIASSVPPPLSRSKKADKLVGYVIETSSSVSKK